MCAFRYNENPLIKTNDVEPSRPDYQVVGVFNAGAILFQGETLLLLRVAEIPLQTIDGIVLIPTLDEKTLELTTIGIERVNKSYDFTDSRVIREKGKTIYLTSLSHLRLASSTDGIHFSVETQPALFPDNSMEAWGIEDPRITDVEGTYYITYSAVSSKGVAVGVATTQDFRHFTRQGLMLPPENKDVALFPEPINGKYYTLHRPVPNAFGNPEIWLAESPDLVHWGQHRYLIGLRENKWDSKRIGGGAVPIKTERGWLVLYHGADVNDRYCMGALLLDLHNPLKILGRSFKPILEPETDYELNGFFGNVVFSCGAIQDGDRIKMYYGAADEMMACAELTLEEIYASMES